ncbi:MAG: formate dehydrogenase subunit alpha [Gammaproteobacteria bacterium]
MAANPDSLYEDSIPFSFNDQQINALPGETLLHCARRLGIEIPYLCYQEGYRPDGNCRACMVEIEGERALAPACSRMPSTGMQVHSHSERALHSQKMVLELLKSEMPAQSSSPYTPNSELNEWCEKLHIGAPRFPPREQPRPDLSNPAIAVNLDACIQCTRCVRACREEQVNDVIGYAFRGKHARIVFDIDDAMGLSSCVSCGECVQACPTGALLPAQSNMNTAPDREVESVCPYCGVGCLVTFKVKENRILSVDGRNGPSNHSRLCVKGRFGFDYVHHPERLTTPLIRKQGMAKTAQLLSKGDIPDYFREASWDEALDLAAGRLQEIRAQAGPQALAGFGSAKGSNEEAYLFQKLVRTGFGTNNVDHCTRLCHASSVAALLETIGSGAVSNPVADVADTEVIIVIGSKPTVNHPVAATFMKNAAKAGKTLIVMDPCRSDLARHADFFLQFHPDTDVPLLNGLMHTIIEEGLHNDQYIQQHTDGFEALKQIVEKYSPEKVAPICGIPAEMLRKVARLYATSRAAMIFWGMGISQHIHGTDNARCLISLALMTGQIGRPGTGLHPLRGQNNVQGASDVGLIPMVYPDYQPVDDDAVRVRFQKIWNTPALDPRPGLTVVEILDAIHNGTMQGMYIMGENPAMSDPNLNHSRQALAKLDHLVVQDIFFTETAGYADVILPASAFPEKTGTFTNTDRRVQLGRQAIDPPGEARQDLWIIQEMAKRLGLDWHYPEVRDVFDEMRSVTPSMGGMTWERLQEQGSLTLPLMHEGDEGQAVLFTDGFPTDSRRGLFIPADYQHADELPDEDYPFVFTTGRQLEHWHTGSMTRRSNILDAIEPLPVASLHPADLAGIPARPGDQVWIESKRGAISVIAREDPGMQKGLVFMAFCYNEAAANLLTNEALDPVGKIPEFKYCAVKLARTAND